MKEIKNKILDCIANENFNQELINDKVKLQNKIDKLQKLIDVIDVLQPLEDEFVIPKKWFLRFNTSEVYNFFNINNKLTCFYPNAGVSNNINGYKQFDLLGNYSYISEICDVEYYTEITFEQFKKYVLNK